MAPCRARGKGKAHKEACPLSEFDEVTVQRTRNRWYVYQPAPSISPYYRSSSIDWTWLTLHRASSSCTRPRCPTLLPLHYRAVQWRKSRDQTTAVALGFGGFFFSPADGMPPVAGPPVERLLHLAAISTAGRPVTVEDVVVRLLSAISAMILHTTRTSLVCSHILSLTPTILCRQSS